MADSVGTITYDSESTELILSLVKTDLGISATAYDSALKSEITYARSKIQDEGLILDETSSEVFVSSKAINLVRRYAVWLWKSREEPSEMPRSLRFDINSALAHQIAFSSEG